MFFIEFETYLISVLVFSYRCLAYVARMRFIRKDLARKCLHPSEAESQLAPSEPLDQRMMSIETDNSPQTIHSKSKKVCGTAFSVKKNAEKLRVIFGPFWVILGPFWVIFGPLWAILGHFWPFMGHFVAF